MLGEVDIERELSVVLECYSHSDRFILGEDDLFEVPASLVFCLPIVADT